MLRRVVAKTLILLVSTCLFPPAGVAIDGSRSIRIGHLGEGIEASVEISSFDGRMSATPQLKIKEDPKNDARTSGDGKEGAKKSLTDILPEGEISFSKGVRLIDQAKEAIRKKKQEKSDAEKTTGGL